MVLTHFSFLTYSGVVVWLVDRGLCSTVQDTAESISHLCSGKNYPLDVFVRALMCFLGRYD